MSMFPPIFPATSLLLLDIYDFTVNLLIADVVLVPLPSLLLASAGQLENPLALAL